MGTARPMEMVLERNGETYRTTVKPELSSDGTYKVMIYGGRYEKTGVLDTLKYSVFEVRYWITTTARSLGKLVTGQVSANELSGPVGIVDMIDDTYQEARSYGWLDVLLNMLNISILLSANLGVVNLLPIPGVGWRPYPVFDRGSGAGQSLCRRKKKDGCTPSVLLF